MVVFMVNDVRLAHPGLENESVPTGAEVSVPRGAEVTTADLLLLNGSFAKLEEADGVPD